MKTNRLFAAFAIVILVLLAGCKKDDFVETVGVCPEVISTIPANTATGVPINQIISVTFNEKMNPATINTSSFKLNGVSGVPGTLIYDGTTPTFSFAPTSPLLYKTTYTGRVATSVKDMAGNALQKEYVWTFTTIEQFTVALSSNPPAGGTTTGAGSFDAGSSVTVSAIASSGYTFTNWAEGNVVLSTDALYTFAISGNRYLIANFTENINAYNVTLTSNPPIGGTTTGAGSYNAGTVVNIGAIANAGYTFTSWTEGENIVSTDASYTFIISGNRILTANFTATVRMYVLRVTAVNGTVTKYPDEAAYNSGTSVLLTAIPNPGYTFTSWSVDATGSENPLTIIMNSDKNITANFTQIADTYSIALSSDPPEGGITTGGGAFSSGTSVTIGATANSNYTFANWTEGANVVSTEASYTFIVNSNRTLVAHFTQNVSVYTVALSSNPTAGGITNGAGSYNSGTLVTVGAIANSGYTFTSWTEGGNEVSTSSSYAFAITGNRTLIANFTQNTKYSVTLSSNPSAGGTTTGEGTYDADVSVTVRATASFGYTFTSWTEGGVEVSNNNYYTFTITGNRILIANFTEDVSTYTLTVHAVNGSVEKNPDLSVYNSGASVQLTAVAISGYSFTSWSGDATGSTNPLTVIMNSNKDITANFTKNAVGPGVVDLGTAGDFAILTKSGIETTGTTSITGDIGVSPAAATYITGFGLIMDANGQSSHTPIVTGKVYAADYAAPTPAKMTTAVNDMETAYTTANGLTAPAPIVDLYAGDISGKTLPGGLYKWSTGVLITNAGVTLTGGPDDTWVFQIAQDLTVNNSAIITLSGGALARNIFWVVAGQATLGTDVIFNGNILSKTLISLNSSTSVTGRLLAQTAVTIIAGTIIKP